MRLVLAEDAVNVKALVRLAEACALMEEVDEGKQALNALLRIRSLAQKQPQPICPLPSHGELLRLQTLLKTQSRLVDSSATKVYSKMFRTRAPLARAGKNAPWKMSRL